MKIENKQDQQQQDKDQYLLKKKGRIVIRNLIYDCNEKHIKQFLSKFGEISEINLPLNPSTGKCKGFAFVQFENKNNALRAIKEANGTKFKGRTVVLDLAIAKQQYTGQAQNGKKQKQNGGDNTEGNNEDEEMEIEEGEQDEDNIKQKEEEVQSESESDFSVNDNQELDMEDISDSEEQEQEKEQKLKVEQEKQEKQKKQEEKPKQKKEQQKNNKDNKQPKEDLSYTIFIRNISYQTTSQEFEEFFKHFGAIYFAKLVINKETGDNKGTGFVKFKDSEIAKKLVQKSQDFEHQTDIIQEPIDLELNGRRLICLQGLNKDQAEQKTNSYDKSQRNKLEIGKAKNLEQVAGTDRQNKRHIKLAKLGTFEVGLAGNELEKNRRSDHIKEKLEKLKNPNNVVSQTRVAFKHLPKKDFDESNLKKLVMKYLKNHIGQQEQQDSKKKEKIIHQVLLLKDAQKGDASKGIGFVEFTNQQNAENFLREITKNIEHFRRDCGNTLPIVEFAIEDIRKIKKYQQIRDQRQKQEQEQQEMIKDQNKAELKQTKKQKNQQQLASKIQLNELLQQECEDQAEGKTRAMELLQGVKSRGAKQRLLLKINKKFENVSESDNTKNANNENQNGDNENQTNFKTKGQLKKDKIETKKALKEKLQKLQNSESEKIVKKSLKEVEAQKKKQQMLKQQQKQEREQMNQVQKTIKNKRKARQQADEVDDLDVTIQQHLKKHQKKAKWDKQ